MIFFSSHILDFHTHRLRQENQEKIMEIVSLHLGKQETPHHFYTIGSHPWWTDLPLNDRKLSVLAKRLEDPKCLALGEIGLDNLKGPAMETQMDIVRSMLPLAADQQMPVIIHCVRAYDQLMQLKKEFPQIQRWCVHGYGRHAILAKQLLDQGFYLSLMPGLPQEKYKELFDALPLDRLFLETDSMPGTSILEVYSEMAAILSLSVTDLCQQMNSNAETFFNP